MILVVGATGILGGMITQKLLEQGRDVRILVRHDSPSEALAAQGMATPANALLDAGAEPFFGDIKDRPSLDAAMADVTTVLTTANSAMRGGEDNPESIEFRGNRTLIDAARTAGVDHFIFTSVLGADVGSSIPFVRGKGAANVHLQQSGMTYTILAPNAFAEAWVGMVVGLPVQAGQPITLVGEGRRLHSFVSISDVAAFAVAAVEDSAARDAVIPIAGPKAVSWREIVAEVEQIIGQKLPLRFVPPGEPVPLIPEAVQGLLAMMDTYDSPDLPMADIAATYDVTLTQMATVLEKMFGEK